MNACQGMEQVKKAQGKKAPLRAVGCDCQRPSWISVNERLPEPMMDVLVVVKDGRISDDWEIEMAWISAKGVWSLSSYPPWVITPALWLPLPAFPVEIIDQIVKVA